jgi:hypothetical protein
VAVARCSRGKLICTLTHTRRWTSTRGCVRLRQMRRAAARLSARSILRRSWNQRGNSAGRSALAAQRVCSLVPRTCLFACRTCQRAGYSVGREMSRALKERTRAEYEASSCAYSPSHKGCRTRSSGSASAWGCRKASTGLRRISSACSRAPRSRTRPVWAPAIPSRSRPAPQKCTRGVAGRGGWERSMRRRQSACESEPMRDKGFKRCEQRESVESEGM